MWRAGQPDGGPNAQDRIGYLKKWEKDPQYLYKNGYEPWNPGLCMVSRELCNILDTISPDPPVNQPPVPVQGDVDGDRDVDLVDFTLLAENWLYGK